MVRATAPGGADSGWERLLLALRRILLALRRGGDQGQGQGRHHGRIGALPPATRLALQAVVALAVGNDRAFLRLFETTAADGLSSSTPSVLLRCLLHKCLPFVRRRTLEGWTKTLFKKERMSLTELARLLCFDDGHQAAAFAALHGVALHEYSGPPSPPPEQESTVRGGGGGDAWGEEEEEEEKHRQPNRAPAAAAGFIEPRVAVVGFPPVAQAYEDRRRQRLALAPRQDALALRGHHHDDGGLAGLWAAMEGRDG